MAARPCPNSVKYGNSKTTTLLPSAKCTRRLFQGRTGCGGRPPGWHDIVTCQRLVACSCSRFLTWVVLSCVSVWCWHISIYLTRHLRPTIYEKSMLTVKQYYKRFLGETSDEYYDLSGFTSSRMSQNGCSLTDIVRGPLPGDRGFTNSSSSVKIAVKQPHKRMLLPSRSPVARLPSWHLVYIG